MRRAAALISPLRLCLLLGTSGNRRGGDRPDLANGRVELASHDALFVIRQRQIYAALNEFFALVYEFQFHCIAVREALLLWRESRIWTPAFDDIRHVRARVGTNGPALPDEIFAWLQLKVNHQLAIREGVCPFANTQDVCSAAHVNEYGARHKIRTRNAPVYFPALELCFRNIE